MKKIGVFFSIIMMIWTWPMPSFSSTTISVFLSERKNVIEGRPLFLAFYLENKQSQIPLFQIETFPIIKNAKKIFHGHNCDRYFHEFFKNDRQKKVILCYTIYPSNEADSSSSLSSIVEISSMSVKIRTNNKLNIENFYIFTPDDLTVASSALSFSFKPIAPDILFGPYQLTLNNDSSSHYAGDIFSFSFLFQGEGPLKEMSIIKKNYEQELKKQGFEVVSVQEHWSSLSWNKSVKNIILHLRSLDHGIKQLPVFKWKQWPNEEKSFVMPSVTFLPAKSLKNFALFQQEENENNKNKELWTIQNLQKILAICVIVFFIGLWDLSFEYFFLKKIFFSGLLCLKFFLKGFTLRECMAFSLLLKKRPDHFPLLATWYEKEYQALLKKYFKMGVKKVFLKLPFAFCFYFFKKIQALSDKEIKAYFSKS